MRSLLILLLITLTFISAVTADRNNDDDNKGPDDALCASYSGLNSTCSSCIIQGCTYCDTTGTGLGGLCLSHRTAHHTCNKNTTLISSFASLTQCRATQHDLYESLSAFIPIITGFFGIIIFLVIFKFVRPQYAPPSSVTEQDVLIVAPGGEGHNAPLLPNNSSRWILIKQKFKQSKLGKGGAAGCCFKLLMVIVMIPVFALSIVAVSAGMWSIQIDGNIHHGKSLDKANSAIAYDGYGMHTITRDPQDHDHLIFRYSQYTCNNVIGDNFIRCSLHRVLTYATHSIAIMALVFICIAVIQMIWSIIRCRSLNSLSVKFMSLAAISHLTAIFVYASGAYLLQSRVYTDSNSSKAMTAFPTPYQLYLGINWDVSIAAFVLNVCLLIPLTRKHIKSIPKPDKNQGSCCCRKNKQQQQQQAGEIISSAPIDANMGVTVAVPIAQVPSTNPFHNPYANGATSYMSPSYQYGTIQTTPAQPAQGQPLHGFTQEI